MRFIAEHKDRRDGGLRWGVESICATLTEPGCPVAPSTYYDAVGRPPSARALREQQLGPQIARVHADDYGVYGARKVWLSPRRGGLRWPGGRIGSGFGRRSLAAPRLRMRPPWRACLGRLRSGGSATLAA